MTAASRSPGETRPAGRGLLLGAPLAFVVAMAGSCAPSARQDPEQAGASDWIGAPASGEWRYWGGDLASTRYSPLARIDRGNVSRLEVAWRWATADLDPSPERRGSTTPIVVDGVMYATAGATRAAVAIDAGTGETLWTYRLDEGERFDQAPRKTSGRGVGFWEDGEDRRVFLVTPGFHLVALDAATGEPMLGFGADGIVDLMDGLRGPTGEEADIGNTSPPLIVGDVLVVGPAHAVSMRPRSRRNTKGDVRGYDARTGELLWTFRTIPEPGEPGSETWSVEGASYTGNAGVWAPMSADPDLGVVYLPVEAPTGDYYGADRPGDNLYGNSLVCLDVMTGQVRWFYQLIHHDIWDWDNPTAPMLVDVDVEGRAVRAVVQLTKQGWAYVFDRVTGEPVWSIEERAVPTSDAPGEATSPTQPFPSRPAAYERQGFSVDDLIDFTPELRAEAVEAIGGYRLGPIYTPPSLGDAPDGTNGTLGLPGDYGGTNWEGGAVDPVAGILYVGSITLPAMRRLGPGGDERDVAYVEAGLRVPRVRGLPLVKPPWGRITAIDLNTGEHLWMIANADTPESVRDHPALEGIDLPRTGTATRPVVLATRTLLFSGEGWLGQPVFRAHDKATGEILAEIAVPASATAPPMSYEVDGRQFIAVSVGDPDTPTEIVALALPVEER